MNDRGESLEDNERATGQTPPGAENPGRHLQDFYAVILGVALVLAVEEVVDSASASSPIDWSLLPLFFAFGALAFSYYHGSVRYLDLMYSPNGPQLSRLRIYSDLLIGAIDMMLLIALAILVGRPLYFVSALTILFIFEVARVFALKRFLPSEQIFPLETEFALIHVVLVPLLIAIFVIGRFFEETETQRLIVGIPLMILMVGRSVVSYRRSFELYFPRQTEQV